MAQLLVAIDVPKLCPAVFKVSLLAKDNNTIHQLLMRKEKSDLSCISPFRLNVTVMVFNAMNRTMSYYEL